MRRWLTILCGLVVAGICGYFAFRRVNLVEAGAALRAADWRLIAWAPLVYAFACLIRAWRWRLVLPAEATHGTRPLFLASAVGVAANVVLPAKLGEVVAAHALGRLAGLSRVQALGIMVVTRAADMTVLLALVVVGAALLPAAELRALGGAASVALALAIAVLAAPALLRPKRMEALIDWGTRHTTRIAGPRVGEFARRFARGLAALRGFRRLTGFLLATCGLWTALGLTLWLAVRAFGLDVSAWMMPLVLAISTVGTMLPSAPGNVGTYHFFAVLGLKVAGVGLTPAAACVLAYHAVDLLSALLLGGAALLLDRAALRDLAAVHSAPQADAESDAQPEAALPAT